MILDRACIKLERWCQIDKVIILVLAITASRNLFYFNVTLRAFDADFVDINGFPRLTTPFWVLLNVLATTVSTVFLDIDDLLFSSS